MRWRRCLAATLAGGLGAVLAACGGGGGPAAAPLSWHESSPPSPPGTHAVLRDATYCGTRWYVVGATEDTSGQTRPAVWASTDALRWHPIHLDPRGDYYAEQEILASVGCSRGRIAVVGAKPGGAHGMPRTATWQQRGDGSLVAVKAPFDVFGGVHSVQVDRLAGGPGGYLIAGTRTSGAAVWRSARGESFRIEEGTPGLASTPRATTQGFGAAWHDDAWWVVGTSVDDAGTESGTSWTPAGPGRWTSHPLPTTASISTAEVATETPHGLVAVGLDGAAFAAWRLTSSRWSQPMTFGERASGGTEAAYVAAVASVGDQVAVTYSDGAHFRLALGGADGPWVDVAPPVSIPVSGDRQLAVTAGPGRFLLIGDDGTSGRVWVADAPAP